MLTTVLLLLQGLWAWLMGKPGIVRSLQLWKAWNCQVSAVMERLELSGICSNGKSGIVRSLQALCHEPFAFAGSAPWV